MDLRYSKIAVIGDVHGEDVRLEILIKGLREKQPDAVFCVGDITDGSGSVDRCCSLLQEYSIETVLGNHDQWCLNGDNRALTHATMLDQLSTSSLSLLQGLPLTRQFDTLLGEAMLCHGVGEDAMASVRPSDKVDELYNNLALWPIYRKQQIKIMINGHSHRPGVRHFNHLKVINVGAVCNDDKAQCALIDFAAGDVDFFRVDDHGEMIQTHSESL